MLLDTHEDFWTTMFAGGFRDLGLYCPFGALWLADDGAGKNTLGISQRVGFLLMQCDMSGFQILFDAYGAAECWYVLGSCMQTANYSHV